MCSKNIKHEDILMKCVCDLFGGDAPKYFGIDKKVIDNRRTELSFIPPKSSFMDYVFLLEDHTLLHFEFESEYRKSDITRFMAYDALLYYKEGKEILTVVVYTADITSVEDTLDIGSIVYKIKPFYMKSLDGDKNYQEIRKKIENKEELTKQDLMSIVFLPLMSGSGDTISRMEQSASLSKKLKI